MVALWIQAGTGLAGDTPLGVRLLGPLATAVGVRSAVRCRPPAVSRHAGPALVAVVAAERHAAARRRLDHHDAGLAAAVLLDGDVWAMARLIASGSRLLVAGGWRIRRPCQRQQIHRGFPLGRHRPVGGGWCRRRGVWLRRWQPWAGVLIGAALFAPVLAWNAAHDWAGLAEAGRPGRRLAALAGGWVSGGTGRRPDRPGDSVGLRPVHDRPGWARCPAQPARRCAGRCWPACPCRRCWCFCSTRSATGCRATGRRSSTRPLALAAAGWLAELGRRDWVGASALGFGITAMVYLQAAFGLVPAAAALDPIAQRLGGWDVLARQVEAARNRHGRDVRRRGRLRDRQRTGLDAASQACRWSARKRAGRCSRCHVRILAGAPDCWCAMRAAPTRPIRSHLVFDAVPLGFVDPARRAGGVRRLPRRRGTGSCR